MVGGDAPKSRPEVSGSGRRARFTRRMRLLRHADFERVYAQGQRHFGTHLTVFFQRRKDKGIRVGLTVGRALGGAVERNRMKRRVREAVRLHWPELAVPVDVVINPKKSVLTVEFSKVSDEVSRAFKAIQKKMNSEDTR